MTQVQTLKKNWRSGFENSLQLTSLLFLFLNNKIVCLRSKQLLFSMFLAHPCTFSIQKVIFTRCKKDARQILYWCDFGPPMKSVLKSTQFSFEMIYTLTSSLSTLNARPIRTGVNFLTKLLPTLTFTFDQTCRFSVLVVHWFIVYGCRKP